MKYTASDEVETSLKFTRDGEVIKTAPETIQRKR
jgi:hypothetical protein